MRHGESVLVEIGGVGDGRTSVGSGSAPVPTLGQKKAERGARIRYLGHQPAVGIDGNDRGPRARADSSLGGTAIPAFRDRPVRRLVVVAKSPTSAKRWQIWATEYVGHQPTSAKIRQM